MYIFIHLFIFHIISLFVVPNERKNGEEEEVLLVSCFLFHFRMIREIRGFNTFRMGPLYYYTLQIIGTISYV